MIENILLGFYFLFLLPKLFFDRLKGKRHPALRQRLGWNLPKPDRPVIWIHAVSVGEIKAVQPLFQRLYSKSFYFFITTTTATGFAEAKRSLSKADFFAYLPLDFTWVVRRFVKRLKPTHFILVESDFWPNLLFALKERGAKLSLVSGKMSKRSAKRFQLFAPFSKRLFSLFDHLCVQNEEHLERFSPFIHRSRLHITGNLKLDMKAQGDIEIFTFSEPVITLGCTHAPEEEKLLEVLYPGPWTLFLAPRHPERFGEVAHLLEKKNIPFTRWSEQKSGKVILIDVMGQMPSCYANSRLAILGGSFVDHIGGHNVLEPCLYGTPVLFGPHMFAQEEFAKRVLEAKAGLQISLSDVRLTVDRFFSNPELENTLREGAKRVIESGRGSTQKTFCVLQNLAQLTSQ